MASCISRYMCKALILLACIQIGSTSLRCYTCKSSFNGDCDDVRGRTLPDEGCENSKLVKAFPQAGTTYVCVVHRMAQSGQAESIWGFLEPYPIHLMTLSYATCLE
ncbi:uncharacterized protein LOC116178163 isoform X3 [Photinus pyralis]|uniref:uncharacterized protein LOC116178163 isoform X3 n=1 Tax=Photinus pyralis TaxID=7054 RepID=UPI00126710E6|nr:uncharacterized protein LOC116178163 isoform X3 [Photinus pyralis]